MAVTGRAAWSTMAESDTSALVAFIEARLQEDELWALAASAGRDPESGTVAGGVHWTWAVGDQWEPVQADPLEPYMGGYEGQWSQPVVLRTVEEWHLSWGGPGNTLPVKIAESEELRTADGAHIARHDPARALRQVLAVQGVLATHRTLVDAGWTDASGRPLELHRLQERWAIVRHLEAVLVSLATIWSDHPDYRDEWDYTPYPRGVEDDEEWSDG